MKTVYFPGHHTGILISQKIKGALAKYDVTIDRISAVIHDGAANAVLAGKLWLTAMHYVFYVIPNVLQ